MKSIVIYRSKTGFTEKYAQWLSQSLNCECVCFEDRAKVVLRSYDVIIYGAGIYMGAVNGLKWFKDSVLHLGRQNVVFAVGAAPSGVDEADRVLAQNFTEEEQKNVKLFYLQGGINYEQMGAGDKFKMSLFKRMMKNRKVMTDAERSMAESIQRSFDVTEPEKLAALLNYIQGL